MFQFQKSRDCWFDSPRRIELHDRALHQHEEQLLVDNQQDDFEDDGRVEREEQLEQRRVVFDVVDSLNDVDNADAVDWKRARGRDVVEPGRQSVDGNDAKL